MVGKVGIVSIGIGNVNSISTVFDKAMVPNVLIFETNQIPSCTHLVLPGVGNFGAYAKQMNNSGLIPEILKHAATDKKPTLGLCVGAQYLLESSEEDISSTGLGLIPGTNKLLQSNDSMFVPRVGWDYISTKSRDLSNRAPLFSPTNNKFYFSHSYKFAPIDPDYISAVSSSDPHIPVLLEKENIIAAQFHPERSSSFGYDFLINFYKFSSDVI